MDLALARGEAAEEVVEAGVAFVVPMELLVVTLQESALAERAPFRLGEEGDVRRGQVAGGGDLDEGIRQSAADGLRQRSRAGEQAGAGHRGEWHRHLELGVIVAAGVLEGLGPAVVEDVFAARMALHVAGRGAQQSAVGPSSASRWRGCQPVRPPTEKDASSDDRKSCEINGL